LTLLFALLNKRLNDESDKWGKKLEASERDDLRRILSQLRSKRNGLYAHVTSCYMETKDYDKEYEELYDCLVNQLPKYGCDPANIERWKMEQLSPRDVERRRQQIEELTENDRSDMLVFAKQLTGEIRNAKAENTEWGSALGKKVDEMCEKVEKVLREVSRGGEDVENHLGAGVRQLVGMIFNINGLKTLLYQMLSKLHDEESTKVLLTTFRDQLKKHVDQSLAMHSQDIMKVIKESTEPISKKMDKVLRTFDELSPASYGKEAAKEQKKGNGDADLDDDLSTINWRLLNFDGADQELQQEIVEPVRHLNNTNAADV
jgi:vacuolar-type H+-ATPase subunit D/Vma8